jgi:hypothetical protein
MAKGIPGLRNIWDGLGWVKDQVNDTLGTVTDVVLSPFVDSEGDLFGLVDMDSLSDTLKKRRQQRQAGITGGGGFLSSAPDSSDISGSDLMGDISLGRVNQIIDNINPNQDKELYKNQAFQELQGIETSKYIDALTNLAKIGETGINLNNIGVDKKPEGPNIKLNNPTKLSELNIALNKMPTVKPTYLENIKGAKGLGLSKQVLGLDNDADK